MNIHRAFMLVLLSVFAVAEADNGSDFWANCPGPACPAGIEGEVLKDNPGSRERAADSEDRRESADDDAAEPRPEDENSETDDSEENSSGENRRID